MATERTPLQSPTTARVRDEEYGYAFVDDDDNDTESDVASDDGSSTKEQQQRRWLCIKSDYFRESDDHKLTPDERQRKQRSATYAAIVLLALLVLFFVWSSLRSASQQLPQPTANATAVTIVTSYADEVTASEFFCGLTDFETGYIQLPNKHDDHYFYWFVASASSEPNNDPLVLWLTGGPGVSSTVALLTENGPCIVQPDLTTRRNEYAWTTAANVIWLDQPTNVGFSYGAPEDADSNEDNVGENIFWFLQGFFDKHPELQGRDFYITGESYGGHYVPAAAHYIWEQNKLKTNKAINLQGIAIGNGLVDALIQYPRYIDMLDNEYNVTFVNGTQLHELQALAHECEERIVLCQRDRTLCFDAQTFCEAHVDAPFTATAERNPFDIRQVCRAGDAQACNAMDYVAAYVNQPAVRAALGVNNERVGAWTLLNEDVHAAFSRSGDFMVSYSTYVAELLDAGVRVLVYAGDADLACNWLGNDAWTKALEWHGANAFNAAPAQRFVLRSRTRAAGAVRTYRNQLTFVRVFDAGHMVPHDQPDVALDLLDRLVNNVSFV